MRRGSADASRADAPNHRHRGLGVTIENLLHVLDGVLHPPKTKPRLSGPQSSCWQDEDYLYIEIAIENSIIPYCDISIVDGKAFIRIVRDQELDEEADLSRPRLTHGIVSIATPIET